LAGVFSRMWGLNTEQLGQIFPATPSRDLRLV
jgi:hypothetical protein